MKAIGPTFGDELRAAGLGDGVAWGADGQITFRADVPEAQRDAVLAAYQAHDPGKAIEPPDPDAALAEAITAATNLAELKAALLGNLQAGQKGRVAGKPV